MLKRIFISLLSFIFLSCGEESQDPDPMNQVDAPETIQEIEDVLATGNSKKWMTSDFKLAGMSLDCRLDDSMELFEDGTFEFDGGDQLCGLEDILRERTGTYEVLVDENKIRFNLSSGETYEASYQKITEEELRLTGSWGGMNILGIFVPSDS